ncbi:unnamed protein product [Amoebophrya sp. A120]|nr:unnamed protein product [Amoebophrya sp. A120]|eukprot:GSA120T00021818001.1
MTEQVHFDVETTRGNNTCSSYDKKVRCTKTQRTNFHDQVDEKHQESSVVHHLASKNFCTDEEAAPSKPPPARFDSTSLLQKVPTACKNSKDDHLVPHQGPRRTSTCATPCTTTQEGLQGEVAASEQGDQCQYYNKHAAQKNIKGNAEQQVARPGPELQNLQDEDAQDVSQLHQMTVSAYDHAAEIREREEQLQYCGGKNNKNSDQKNVGEGHVDQHEDYYAAADQFYPQHSSAIAEASYGEQDGGEHHQYHVSGRKNMSKYNSYNWRGEKPRSAGRGSSTSWKNKRTSEQYWDRRAGGGASTTDRDVTSTAGQDFSLSSSFNVDPVSSKSKGKGGMIYFKGGKSSGKRTFSTREHRDRDLSERVVVRRDREDPEARDWKLFVYANNRNLPPLPKEFDVPDSVFSIIIRNISNQYYRDEFLEDMLEVCGVERWQLAYFYVPVDVLTSQSLGYAHVCFWGTKAAHKVAEALHNGQFERHYTHKYLKVEASRLQSHGEILSHLYKNRYKYKFEDACPLSFRPSKEEENNPIQLTDVGIEKEYLRMRYNLETTPGYEEAAEQLSYMAAQSNWVHSEQKYNNYQATYNTFYHDDHNQHDQHGATTYSSYYNYDEQVGTSSNDVEACYYGRSYEQNDRQHDHYNRMVEAEHQAQHDAVAHQLYQRDQHRDHFPGGGMIEDQYENKFDDVNGRALASAASEEVNETTSDENQREQQLHSFFRPPNQTDQHVQQSTESDPVLNHQFPVPTTDNFNQQNLFTNGSSLLQDLQNSNTVCGSSLVHQQACVIPSNLFGATTSTGGAATTSCATNNIGANANANSSSCTGTIPNGAAGMLLSQLSSRQEYQPQSQFVDEQSNSSSMMLTTQNQDQSHQQLVFTARPNLNATATANATLLGGAENISNINLHDQEHDYQNNVGDFTKFLFSANSTASLLSNTNVVNNSSLTRTDLARQGLSSGSSLLGAAGTAVAGGTSGSTASASTASLFSLDFQQQIMTDMHKNSSTAVTGAGRGQPRTSSMTSDYNMLLNNKHMQINQQPVGMTNSVVQQQLPAELQASSSATVSSKGQHQQQQQQDQQNGLPLISV